MPSNKSTVHVSHVSDQIVLPIEGFGALLVGAFEDARAQMFCPDVSE